MCKVLLLQPEPRLTPDVCLPVTIRYKDVQRFSRNYHANTHRYKAKNLPGSRLLSARTMLYIAWIQGAQNSVAILLPARKRLLSQNQNAHRQKADYLPGSRLFSAKTKLSVGSVRTEFSFRRINAFTCQVADCFKPKLSCQWIQCARNRFRRINAYICQLAETKLSVDSVHTEFSLRRFDASTCQVKDCFQQKLRHQWIQCARNSVKFTENQCLYLPGSRN